jgi:CRISPR-associated Csx3 family protein
LVFGILLELVAGICSYDATSLEQIHLKHAPFPVVNERELAQHLSVPMDGERMIWSPRHLSRISEFIPASSPLAIYDRGPVWLASTLAALTLPESFAIFDARYGWMIPPVLWFQQEDVTVEMTILPFQNSDAWVDLHLPSGTLEPDEIILNPIPVGGGIILSGKIPRWLFATLVHKLAADHDWLAVDDPRLRQVILVYSKIDSVQVGNTFPRLVKANET